MRERIKHSILVAKYVLCTLSSARATFIELHFTTDTPNLIVEVSTGSIEGSDHSLGEP